MGQAGALLLRGTVANYLLMAWRLGTSIFLTRMLYLGLGTESYGFWSLLWAVFGYSILLDFGFGQTVQKYTAEMTATGDIKRFNAIVSTVILSYCALAAVIVVATLALAPFLDVIFAIAPGQDLDTFRTAFLVFGVGVAMVFPTGIFNEIMAGLRRLDLRNAVLFVNTALNLLGVWLLFRLGYSIVALALFSAVLNFSTNIVMVMVVRRLIPGFSVSLWHFDAATVRGVGGFSLSSYLYTFANMLATRTARIVLGVMMGMGAVAVYQIGTRLSEMLERLTTQFQEGLGPLAASLHKSGETEKLRWMMLRSAKVAAFMSTFPFLALLILAAPTLKLWLKIDDPVVVQTSWVMLASIYLAVLMRSAQTKFLMMAGRHAFVAKVQWVEAIASLALSIVLAHLMGVLGVAFAALLPNALIGMLVVFPATAKFGGMTVGYYLRKVYLPLVLPSIPAAAILCAAMAATHAADWSLFRLGATVAAAGAVYSAIGALFFFSAEERSRILELLKGKNKKS